MTTNELMRNDWVKLAGTNIFCRVDRIDADSISGVTASGSRFEQKISKFEAIALDRDILLRTSMWLASGKVFRKIVARKVGFEYNLDIHRLEVLIDGASQRNMHYGIWALHQLQHLYRHYSQGEELSVNILHNKAKEYNRVFYEERRKPDMTNQNTISNDE